MVQKQFRLSIKISDQLSDIPQKQVSYSSGEGLFSKKGSCKDCVHSAWFIRALGLGCLQIVGTLKRSASVNL